MLLFRGGSSGCLEEMPRNAGLTHEMGRPAEPVRRPRRSLVHDRLGRVGREGRVGLHAADQVERVVELDVVLRIRQPRPPQEEHRLLMRHSAEIIQYRSNVRDGEHCATLLEKRRLVLRRRAFVSCKRLLGGVDVDDFAR